ncbi:MAG: ABC transporter permease [Tissierella sp.]|nr:ABC transporter permease [Tissierella sp.]
MLNRFINENTGRKEATIVTPIDSKFADKVTERLGEYEDTSIFGVGEDMETYDAIVPSEMISSQMLEAMKDQYPEEQASYLLSSEILTVDPQNYTLLCEKAKVPVGSNILMNHYSYNDNGELVTISPFLYEGGQLRLTPADDSIYEIPIHGILEQGDVPNELLGPNANTVRLIVPQGEMRGYTWYANPGDVEGFMDYANELMGEMFPRGQESAYMELGFTTRVYKIQDYMKIMNIFVVFAEVFVYSFVALLTLIGLTNVISTMSTNVRMRSKEFAVLQSVGMTYNGLNRMLNLESIMCSAKSLMIGLPLGILFTYLINLSIRSTFPVPYQLPWFAVIWCIAVVFGITWVTMRYSAVQLQRRNIIETIRLEA